MVVFPAVTVIVDTDTLLWKVFPSRAVSAEAPYCQAQMGLLREDHCYAQRMLTGIQMGRR